MSLAHLEGRGYGPFHLRTAGEKVFEFVAATGDDHERWQFFAPPGFAAFLLFAAAPHFLGEEDVAEVGEVLVHVDQVFRWQRPLPLEEDVSVTGVVDSVRQRGHLTFVGFSTRVDGQDGNGYLDTSSTFLISDQAAARQAEEREPAWDERADNEEPAMLALPEPGEALPPLLKSASRADLVRYAGATRDWNPIHWDHRAALAAGFPGVVVHGLLMAAWVAQAAGRFGERRLPLEQARLRFRQPLRPGVSAAVMGNVKTWDEERASLSLAVVAGDTELVAADATVKRAGESR